ncbi:AAA domain-containing protein [Sphingomonas psychrotolerans]|uniref:AAA domain-containing protein n=1 Tax=Sphingomonas psychrotolerans TaxID=1327635 RepID=A0ABU3N7S1_9SPHN|nr:AAA domain-containing protein [Sphingomonas psychrotolerans]
MRYLSSAGIQHREVKGLDALAKTFPGNWIVYASLNAFPRNSPPIEIDVFVVMDDRIVLLELKDWNGPLTYKKDKWHHAGRFHRSPVVLGNEKAKKIKGMVSSQIPSIRDVYVDSRVVLTATSTRDLLHPDEQPYVLTLEEARRLGDRKDRNKLLGTVRLTRQPNMYTKDFEKFFEGGTYFQPLKMSWDGYEVTDQDFYVHRRDVWREHRAELKREERMKALLRLFRFDKLPVGLNEPGGRQMIADRELKTVAYLGDQGSWMAENGILGQIGTPAEEILTEHYQLISVPSGWTTLRRFLARSGEDLLGEHRLDIVHKLASMVAELHTHGVAHRDIGGDAVWMGSPTTMSMTGFFSATIPDDQSVSDYLEDLRTYADDEPEWDGVPVTGKERDVYSIGTVMRDLSELKGDIGSFPPGWNEVMGKALARPGERYSDARGLADALGELRTPSGPTVDQSRLDGFETSVIPYVSYPMTGEMHASGGSSRYDSGSGSDRKVVKVWNGLSRGDARRDHTMLSMLEAAASLIAVPLAGTAPVLACGLSPVGPFVVTSWVEGGTFAEVLPDEPSLLDIFDGLIQAIDTVHARGLSHGDLHPSNIVVAADMSVRLIDMFDVSAVGEGRVRSLSWAPEDHERRSDQQIDRFAVCRMVALRAEAAGSASMVRIALAAKAELERVSIETLAPLLEAIALERRRLLQPPIREFKVAATTLPPGLLKGDEDHLWIKAFRQPAGREVFWVTGLNGRLLLRLKNGEVDAVEFTEAKLSDLGQGERIPIRIELDQGKEAGVLALAEYLRSVVTPEEYIAPAPVEDTPAWEGEEADLIGDDVETDVGAEGAVDVSPLRAFNVARMWLRSAEIEEETVLRVRLDRRMADEGNTAFYEYQTPQPLEFEDEDTVEVRLGGVTGRLMGLLDVPRSDDRQLAVRDQRFPILEGEFVSLVDRRDRVSKERRRRAVDRITKRASVIPSLIDYFDPGIDAPESSYPTDVPEETLLAYGLNTGQRRAFRALLATGPLGMLQGPPGSGKTRFIASLAHWLLSEGGARRVLVASQSHEAVNNVLEELLKTYREHGGVADMLRVGSRGATERVRPYQARSLRDRYRLRFENGLKTRVAHAAAAAGIPRALVHEVVDVDQRLGVLHRSMMLIVVSSDGEITREEKIRSERRVASLAAAFSREASQILGRDIEAAVGEAGAILDEAFEEALARHPKVSPGDLVTVRKLLNLANDWQNTLATGQRNFDEFLAKTRRVVAGTCVGLGQSQIRLDEGAFDWVIVDEAARCTSGELAVPLQLGSRVILVGDQRQLRPMIDRAVQIGLRREFRGFGSVLAKSDFERAFDSPYGHRNALVLDEQYRMAPDISNLVSEIFYAPHGVKLNPSKDRKPDGAFLQLPADLSDALVWFDTRGMPDAEELSHSDGRDIWNEAEIVTVINILQRLANETTLVEELARRNEPAIGVICMYSEQKRRIEREWSQLPFPEAFRRLVTIDTVDAYQGKENSIVIVTLVRSNPDHMPGHVGRENRCNVALSRAKERLYIVGDSEMWSSPETPSPMRKVFLSIRAMKRNGKVVPAREITK